MRKNEDGKTKWKEKSLLLFLLLPCPFFLTHLCFHFDEQNVDYLECEASLCLTRFSLARSLPLSRPLSRHVFSLSSIVLSSVLVATVICSD